MVTVSKRTRILMVLCVTLIASMTPRWVGQVWTSMKRRHLCDESMALRGVRIRNTDISAGTTTQASPPARYCLSQSSCRSRRCIALFTVLLSLASFFGLLSHLQRTARAISQSHTARVYLLGVQRDRAMNSTVLSCCARATGLHCPRRCIAITRASIPWCRP